MSTETKQINIDSLKDVPHVGPVSLNRLKKEGFETMLQVIAEMSITDFKEITGMDRDKAADAFAFMREELVKANLVPKMTMTAEDLLKQQSEMPRLLIGVKSIDALMSSEKKPEGGLEYGAITEFYGEPGSGKTQTLHQLIYNMLVKEPDGLVVYIDTEQTFQPERLQEIATNRGTQIDLSHVIVVKVHHADMQVMALSQVNSMLAEKAPLKMMVVDSATALFREEFLGRGNTKAKFDLLNRMVHKAKGIAEFWKIPVIFVNQIYHKPDEMYGRDPDIPVGGNILGHAMQCRIKLSIVGSGKKHKAKMMKSPYHANNEAVFQITNKGIEDVE